MARKLYENNIDGDFDDTYGGGSPMTPVTFSDEMSPHKSSMFKGSTQIINDKDFTDEFFYVKKGPVDSK